MAVDNSGTTREMFFRRLVFVAGRGAVMIGGQRSALAVQDGVRSKLLTIGVSLASRWRRRDRKEGVRQ
jgi:hypothetical protein